jgi:uncharacterized protein (DUF885 family)
MAGTDPTDPTDPTELLDRFWATHVELDDRRPLWDSDIDQLERWPSTSVAHTEQAKQRLLALRDEALERAAAAGAAGAAPSLRTAADAAFLLAVRLDADTEFSYAHPLQGLHSYLYWAVNNFPLRTAEHGQRYLDKMAGFPAAADELRERLEAATAADRPMIERHARDAAHRIGDQLAAPVEQDPLLAQAPPVELGEDAVARWRADLAAAVETHVRPALGRLRRTLQDVVAAAGRPDEECGLCHVPGGEQEYARLVEAFTTPGTTPDQVHETGLAQLERLAQEYRELGSRALGTDDLDTVLARLRDDPGLRHDTPDAVVAAARSMHERAEQLAPDWFARTPQADCDVRATSHGAIAFYSPPSRDGDRGGVFFFNTSDPSVWGSNLASTVFHEGIPGHHFQAALAIEDDTLHDLHRQLFLPAFGEGWGLYAERLADEMGLYTDDLQRLGMLTADAMRACRLVVDTGIHHRGWSRQQAIDFMAEHTPTQHVAVVREIDRYIGTPGQATSYMMGRLELQRLREESATRLGDAFDVRDFHGVVLSRGMVSLPALRQVVEAWQGGPAA